MKAGRELDAKVAKVLGYAVIDDYRQYSESSFVTDEAHKKFQRDYIFDEPPELLLFCENKVLDAHAANAAPADDENGRIAI